MLFACASASAQPEVYTSSGKSRNHKKAQASGNKKKGYDPDRLILGGGVNGLNYSSVYASAGISLIAGYRITKNLSAGLGLGYLYYQEAVEDHYSSKPNYIRQYIASPNIWARYVVYRNFFVSATLEHYFITKRAPIDVGYNMIRRDNYQTTVLMPGAGFRIPLGGRLMGYAEARMAVYQSPLNVYPLFQPMLNYGFAAGL